MDMVEALTLVDRIYTRLNNRRPDIEQAERYYLGDQPLTFATTEWLTANASRYHGFSDNWSAPVVNAAAERIRYTGMKLPSDAGEDAAKGLHETWLRNDGDMQSAQGFVTSLTTGRAFVIVWGDKSTDEPLMTWEHPSSVEIEYDFANPRIREAALKTWADETLEYATLYTPTYVWKFQRKRIVSKSELESQAQQAKVGVATSGGWSVRELAGEPWPLPNPIGLVPVVEVPNRPTLRGDPVSEIRGVIPMQDAINMLWAYLFLAADYASMPARVVLNASPPMVPVLDADGKKISEKPVDMKELSEKRLFYVSGEGSIDSWEAARLDVFTDTIDVAVGHIASQTRTPPTYLVSKTGMSNVNGEGLKASEIGLNKKVQEFENFAGSAMREVNRLIALVQGDEALADLVRLGKATWMDPEIRSESQMADALQKKRSMGYPFEYILELDGVEPLEIDRILALKLKEEKMLLDFAVQDAVNGMGNAA